MLFVICLADPIRSGCWIKLGPGVGSEIGGVGLKGDEWFIRIMMKNAEK